MSARTCWTHDEKEDLWYFHLHGADGKAPIDPPVHRTESIGVNRTVNIDYDEAGDVIGVEVI